MNEGPVNQGSMVETTDCLEAVSVFRGWKNIFFVVVLVSLLAVQVAFWLINLGVVEPTAESEAAIGEPQAVSIVPAVTEATDANQADQDLAGGIAGGFDFELLARIIEVASGVLIVAAILYASTIFFSLLVSLVGGLAGINHISRAFILSLIMAVLIIPWQNVFGSSVVGVVYAPEELLQWLQAKGDSTANMVIFYLRFTVYWLVALLLLILSQTRTARWSKAIVRRLEII